MMKQELLMDDEGEVLQKQSCRVEEKDGHARERSLVMELDRSGSLCCVSTCQRFNSGLSITLLRTTTCLSSPNDTLIIDLCRLNLKDDERNQHRLRLKPCPTAFITRSGLCRATSVLPRAGESSKKYENLPVDRVSAACLPGCLLVLGSMDRGNERWAAKSRSTGVGRFVCSQPWTH
ncbi:hypothetical protein BJX66DRAFT_248053 [Aspergillus keveii]|uniref:Uncharacterized protein n=1 Tax=Aspergillus keveii TaxID=714993 RepID=A0ABR4G042_9EURO